MINKITFTTILMIIGVIRIWGQTPANVSAEINNSNSLQDIDTILTEAYKQTENYREAFKNLLAIETKTFEKFGKNNEVKDKKIVESNFLVYQSSKNAKISSELRSVIKVDGKPVSDSVERSERLFVELQKTSTLKSELEKIQKEGNRYDDTLEVSGLTLHEGIVLSANFRPYFDFKLEGTENYQGNDVFVISYLQTKKSPYINLNEKEKDGSLSLDFQFDLPKNLRKSDAFIHGKLWIDSKTYQIRREERILTVQTDNPVTVMESTFDYQPSNYEIFVPKQISVTTNKITEKDKKYTVAAEYKVTFNYSEFKKSETDVKILDDTETN